MSWASTLASTLALLDIIRRLAIGLQVSADLLLFDRDVGDLDDELRRQFEAGRQFDADERHMAQCVLEALILKHQNKRFFLRESAAQNPPSQKTPPRSKAAKARSRPQGTCAPAATRR